MSYNVKNNSGIGRCGKITVFKGDAYIEKDKAYDSMELLEQDIVETEKAVNKIITK